VGHRARVRHVRKPLSNDLIVGNFGDGAINVFDSATGEMLGRLNRSKNKPIIVDGLWSLVVGDSAIGSPNTFYFTAVQSMKARPGRDLYGTDGKHRTRRRLRHGPGLFHSRKKKKADCK
jgi:hypothetical protein